MKLKVYRKQLGGLAPAQWVQRSGYSYHTDRHSGQDSFVRRLNGDFYPRFHLYIQELPGMGEVMFNLHLDQKKASYAGVSRHSGEYEGEVVEQEAARLRSLMLPLEEAPKEQAPARRENIPSEGPRDVLHSLQPQELKERPAEKKLPWWKRIFS